MELLRVFNNYYLTKTDYCVICLRSSDERRLVNVKSVEKFLLSVNLPCSFINEFQKVCYVCERQALAAYRFRLAVNLSSSVHNLFHLMKTPKARSNVIKQIHGEKPFDGVMRNVPEWEQRLAAVRMNTQLLQTEVLCVNNLTTKRSASKGGIHTVMYPRTADGPSDGTYGDSDVTHHVTDETDVTDGTPLRDPVHDLLSEPEIYMDSVLILDEEEDPIRTDTPNYTTINNNIETTPTDPQSLEKLLNNPPAPSDQNPSFLLHPIVEKDGIVSVPSLAAQIINGQLVTLDKSNIIIQIPKLALQNGKNFDLLTDPAQVNEVLKSIAGNAKRYSVVSDVMPLNILENNVAQSVDFRNFIPNPLNDIVANIASVQNNPNLNQITAIAGVQNNQMVENVQNTLVYAQPTVMAGLQNNQMERVENVQNNLVFAQPTIGEVAYAGCEAINVGDNVPMIRPILCHQNGVEGNPGLALGPGNSASYIPTQMYNAGIQHMNVPCTDNFAFIINPEESQRNNPNNETAIGGGRTQKEMDNRQCSEIEGYGKQNEIQIVNRPQRETDWEDKIPMDVISFMDAIDPNADAVLKAKPPNPLEPTFGLITNVHTVTEGENIHNDPDVILGEALRNNDEIHLNDDRSEVDKATNAKLFRGGGFAEEQKAYKSMTTQTLNEVKRSKGIVKLALRPRRRSARATQSDLKRTKNCESEVIDLE